MNAKNFKDASDIDLFYYQRGVIVATENGFKTYSQRNWVGSILSGSEGMVRLKEYQVRDVEAR